MKSKHLILGYFHKCGDDEERFDWIKSFLIDNADFDSELLLETENSMIVAFATMLGEEDFEGRWENHIGNIPATDRPAFFDHITDLTRIKFWELDIPLRLTEISKKLISK